MEEHNGHIHHHNHDPLKFPEGFLWGAATSSHQVEGENIHNDWWQWEQTKGHVKNDEKSSKATDHYNRFEEDFTLAQQMNHNAHRLSIEWSRIEPEEGKWNEEEVEHYRKVLQSLRAKNMKVMLTLHHFTVPQWFAAKGGWQSAEAPEQFVRFAEKMAIEYKDLVDLWCTINEPIVYVSMSYVNGIWPPQKKSFFAGFIVLRHLAKAHRMAYEVIHDIVDDEKVGRKAQVGIAKNLISFMTVRNKLLDYIAMRISDYFWNDYFFKLTKFTHDYIGVNYYFHTRLMHIGGVKFRNVDVVGQGKREASDLGWEIFAPGLHDVLGDLARYNVPIYITENGIATSNDDKRARYIVQHLKEVYHSIQSGVDIQGYFYWSLLDNFEWHQGFEPRFGLIHVDYDTLKRTPKESSQLYAAIAKENAITHRMLRLMGHGISALEVLEDENKKA